MCGTLPISSKRRRAIAWIFCTACTWQAAFRKTKILLFQLSGQNPFAPQLHSQKARAPSPPQRWASIGARRLAEVAFEGTHGWWEEYAMSEHSCALGQHCVATDYRHLRQAPTPTPPALAAIAYGENPLTGC